MSRSVTYARGALSNKDLAAVILGPRMTQGDEDGVVFNTLPLIDIK